VFNYTQQKSIEGVESDVVAVVDRGLVLKRATAEPVHHH